MKYFIPCTGGPAPYTYLGEIGPKEMTEEQANRMPAFKTRAECKEWGQKRCDELNKESLMNYANRSPKNSAEVLSALEDARAMLKRKK